MAPARSASHQPARDRARARRGRGAGGPRAARAPGPGPLYTGRGAAGPIAIQPNKPHMHAPSQTPRSLHTLAHTSANTSTHCSQCSHARRAAPAGGCIEMACGAPCARLRESSDSMSTWSRARGRVRRLGTGRPAARAGVQSAEPAGRQARSSRRNVSVSLAAPAYFQPAVLTSSRSTGHHDRGSP